MTVLFILAVLKCVVSTSISGISISTGTDRIRCEVACSISTFKVRAEGQHLEVCGQCFHLQGGRLPPVTPRGVDQRLQLHGVIEGRLLFAGTFKVCD